MGLKVNMTLGIMMTHVLHTQHRQYVSLTRIALQCKKIMFCILCDVLCLSVRNTDLNTYLHADLNTCLYSCKHTERSAIIFEVTFSLC